MEISENEIVEVENNYKPPFEEDDEYWGRFEWAGVGSIRYELKGNTRQMVLNKLGKTDGIVAVVEDHRDGGYCPSCTFEYINFWIEVDGKIVWEQQFTQGSPFEELQRWLVDGYKYN